MRILEYAIEMLNITKEFPGIKANDDITLQVKKGEVHALLGENGAGKSTLLKILAGVLPFDKGQVLLNGKKPDMANAEFSKEVGDRKSVV